MSKQPKALRLAYALEIATADVQEDGTILLWLDGTQIADEAAAELRRLEAANKELMKLLKWLDNWLGEKPMIECADRIRVAIAKHGA